jgi:GntR family transcriptional regulator
MKSLNRVSGVPLYLQIRDIIHREILSGNFVAGQQIPSEDDLAKIFNVSRMTVRQGLAELLSDGVLYKQHGVGTFVSQTHVEANYTKLTSFTSDANDQGKIPASNLLGIDRLKADSIIQKPLDLPETSMVVCLKRLRLADGQPVAIQQSYVPASICPTNLESYDWSKQSLFELLDRNGHIPTRAIETISAVNANREEATLLGLKTGAPLIYIERVTFDSKGMPMEFVKMWNRPDRYKCTIQLHRQK